MHIDGEQLRKIRTVYRMSFEEFGALLGVSGRFIHYVEKGERLFPEARQRLLITELDLTPEKLMKIESIYDEGERHKASSA